MSQYVITRKNTFEIDNQVYFADTLKGAGETIRDLLLEDESNEWIIAVVLDS
jgi:hypothetical protein